MQMKEKMVVVVVVEGRGVWGGFNEKFSTCH